MRATVGQRPNALIRLAFAVASSPQGLNRATRNNSSAHSSIGTVSPTFALAGYGGLHLLVSVWFQILFHRPPGLLFSVPSLYLFTIGQEEYLALPHRHGCFPQDFSSPVVLRIRDIRGQGSFRLPGYHRLWLRFPTDSTKNLHSQSGLLGSPASRPQHHLCVSPSSSSRSAVKLASNSVS